MESSQMLIFISNHLHAFLLHQRPGWIALYLKDASVHLWVPGVGILAGCLVCRVLRQLQIHALNQPVVPDRRFHTTPPLLVRFQSNDVRSLLPQQSPYFNTHQSTMGHYMDDRNSPIEAGAAQAGRTWISCHIRSNNSMAFHGSTSQPGRGWTGRGWRRWGGRNLKFSLISS